MLDSISSCIADSSKEYDSMASKVVMEDLLASLVFPQPKSISIAAASVIAKVTRDEMMYKLDKKYPMYGFKNHKGYPTKAHLEAISKYGLIEGYRKSYKPVLKVMEGDKV